MNPVSIQVKNLDAFYGNTQVLFNINLKIPTRSITALIGPSGCGKSTFLKCLNRIHEISPDARMTGQLMHESQDLWGPSVDPTELRQNWGMLFQKPVLFSGLNLFENVALGLKWVKRLKKYEMTEQVQKALIKSCLWEEVKDKLDQPGEALSGGQQQRLCLARALVMEPKVLLLDEPTSALDPIATQKIESVIQNLSKEMTIILVTHNLKQAHRLSKKTAYFYMGQLLEEAPTETFFIKPKLLETQQYIEGRFG